MLGGRRASEKTDAALSLTRGNRTRAANQYSVVKRKDSQRAAGIEVSEVVRLPFGVEENPGDEKARQDKEQIDASETQ